eukprot:5656608-Amphidinium_carterae.1
MHCHFYCGKSDHFVLASRRYVDLSQDFDLDLSYVDKRVIAMSVPGYRFHALYRNPLYEVAI